MGRKPTPRKSTTRKSTPRKSTPRKSTRGKPPRGKSTRSEPAKAPAPQAVQEAAPSAPAPAVQQPAPQSKSRWERWGRATATVVGVPAGLVGLLFALDRLVHDPLETHITRTSNDVKREVTGKIEKIEPRLTTLESSVARISKLHDKFSDEAMDRLLKKIEADPVGFLREHGYSVQTIKQWSSDPDAMNAAQSGKFDTYVIFDPTKNDVTADSRAKPSISSEWDKLPESVKKLLQSGAVIAVPNSEEMVEVLRDEWWKAYRWDPSRQK